MASSPDALQARLDQLEANVRKWQRTNRFWVWGLLAFIAAMLFYGVPVGRPAGTVHQMLSARQVALVDTQNNVRALLGVHEDGSPFVGLRRGRAPPCSPSIMMARPCWCSSATGRWWGGYREAAFS